MGSFHDTDGRTEGRTDNRILGLGLFLTQVLIDFWSIHLCSYVQFLIDIVIQFLLSIFIIKFLLHFWFNLWYINDEFRDPISDILNVSISNTFFLQFYLQGQSHLPVLTAPPAKPQVRKIFVKSYSKEFPRVWYLLCKWVIPKPITYILWP